MSHADKGVWNTKIILIGLFIIGVAIGTVILWQAIIGFGLVDGTTHLKVGDVPNHNIYGTFGDFIGGTLNPIFAFLTFLGLLYTIFMQSKELGYTRQELEYTRKELQRSASAFEQQNFDNTFFNLTKTLSETVRSAHYDNKDVVNARTIPTSANTINNNGQQTFQFILSLLLKMPPSPEDDSIEFEVWFDFYAETSTDPHSDSHAFFITYRLEENCAKYRQINFSAWTHYIFEEYSSELDHYFRVFFNTLRLIDETDGIDKQKYVRLLRANLSEAELALIFYNCFTRDGEALIPLVEEYAIFDNLTRRSINHIPAITQLERSAFGNNETLLNLYEKIVDEGRAENMIFAEDRLL